MPAAALSAGQAGQRLDQQDEIRPVGQRRIEPDRLRRPG